MKVYDTKAVLLVGGLGTRLRTLVPSTPKALAPIGNRPFLELLIRQLACQGICNLIMCTGYLADQIEREFGDGGKFGVAIEYSRELHPLGTGGAVKLAQNFLRDVREFIVLNGDSFLEIDFSHLVRFHQTHGALASIAVVAVENAGRYGAVHTDANDRVIEFREKAVENSPGLINAGVYVFSPAIFEQIPAGTTSLEKNVFPCVLNHGVFAARQQGLFIDIGTPADYARAQKLLERLRSSTSQASGI